MFNIFEIDEYADFPTNKFWKEEKSGDSYEVSISKVDLLDFLHRKGFYKIYKDNTSMYIRILNNIIHYQTPEQIHDYILKYVRNAKMKLLVHSENNKTLENKLLNANNIYLNGSLIKLLKETKIDVFRDTKESAHFFFKNCIVKVTKDGITQLKYSEVHKQIWAKQIIDHNYNPINKKSDFTDFLSKVANNDKERFSSIVSLIGYLLHSHKDPSIAKAIVFLDETLNDTDKSEGRSGKGLVAESISKLRTMIIIDGKDFKPNNNFLYQEVNLDTQIIFFDDVKKDFHFEQLYSVLTSGITVDKKYKEKFKMPFKDSPKILITTNFAITGRGGSHEDRIFEYEFSNYFNKDRKPIDEYSGNFFEDWSAEEWDSFFSVLFQAVKHYLKNGLIKYSTINATAKKIITETSKEFHEYVEKLEVNKEYDKKEQFEEFKSEIVDFNFHQRTFTKWLQIYCDYKELKFKERSSSGNHFFTFSKKENSQ